jgi:PAS domain S-box-containing protein
MQVAENRTSPILRPVPLLDAQSSSSPAEVSHGDSPDGDTGRADLDESLRHRATRYQALFESIEDGFCVIEVMHDETGTPNDYRFLEINPAFERQSGISNALGRTMREFAPDHEKFWFQLYGNVARTRQTARAEHHATALGRWFTVYAFPVDAPALQRVGVLFSDITERTLASSALQASEQFSRAVMQSSPDCIKVLDSEGRLLSINGAGLCLMEIDDFAPFVNQPWHDLWGAENFATVKDAIGRALRGETVRFQAVCATAKGTMKWWDVAVAPIAPGTEGAPIERLVSVSRDITENKRAEEALQRARMEAEAANRAKDQFLAALSHELRTPLNPVLLTASSLSEDETLPASVREQLRMIERNIALEARLIDDLLDLTRIAHGKLPLHTQPCDVHTLLALVVEMVRDDALEKQIDIQLELAAKKSGVSGDPARLQQVYWNLLRNAVKFTPPGGRVVVRSRDENASPAQQLLRVEVADNGIGIAPEKLTTIFEPFEQGNRRRDEALGGLGLGLAIAKAIVERHHGTLRAESSGPNQGSTFIVETPSARPPSAPVFDSSPGSGGRDCVGAEPPLRLLVVEDHEPTLQVLSRLLSRAGHQVVPAASVAAARQAAAAQEFDGLISDVGLPDGTGIELMAELSATYGMRGIALSGYGMADDLRQSRDVGFVAHLVKPVNISDLRRELRNFAPSRSSR